jgi:hypothetical protein
MDNMQPTMSETPRGTKSWRRLGLLHRTDGPAIEWSYGPKSWYLHGKSISFDEWLGQNQTLTDEEKVMYKLAHG